MRTFKLGAGDNVTYTVHSIISIKDFYQSKGQDKKQENARVR